MQPWNTYGITCRITWGTYGPPGLWNAKNFQGPRVESICGLPGLFPGLFISMMDNLGSNRDPWIHGSESITDRSHTMTSMDDKNMMPLLQDELVMHLKKNWYLFENSWSNSNILSTSDGIDIQGELLG